MATTFNLNRPQNFPEGTEVGAYPESNWETSNLPSGAPKGSATSTVTVSSGIAAFTELNPSTTYWAVASVGGTYRYVKFQTGPLATIKIEATSDGDNTVVAAVTGKRIAVVDYVLNVTAEGAVSFKDSAATYAPFTLAKTGGVVRPPADESRAAFTTGIGKALLINNAAGVDTKGHLTYRLV